MEKYVTIEWGPRAPWMDDKVEARRVREEYLQAKFAAGQTTDSEGTHHQNFSVISRTWIDQAAAEEEVAWITSFANTYGLDIVNINISDV